MTYCIAWKSLNTVYLISDTAITVDDESGNYELSKDKTSLGEDSIYTPTRKVEEWVHKQQRIGDELIFSFAGDVEVALDIIATTKKYYDRDNPMKSFELALDSRRDLNGRPSEVCFLIGAKIKNEICLFTYNYNKSRIIEFLKENQIIQIGSLANTQFSELTNTIFSTHIMHLTKPQMQFYQFLGFMQQYGLHDNTLLSGAGGIYSGIYIDKEGAHWGADTSIIVYNRNLKNPTIEVLGRINHFVRYDSLINSSTLNDSKEIFVDGPDNPLFQSQSLQEEIQKEHSNFKPQIMFFLAKDEKIIVTIKTNGNNSNMHFNYITESDLQKTALSPVFTRRLKGELWPNTGLYYLYWDEVFPLSGTSTYPNI